MATNIVASRPPATPTACVKIPKSMICDREEFPLEHESKRIPWQEKQNSFCEGF